MDEITAEHYKADVDKVMSMMLKSQNMNMLKALYTEIWRKATAQDDKDMQMEAQKVYNELKDKFEPENKK